MRRRHSRRRRHSIRANRRHHRRVRRNPDWMREVVTPVAGGTAGFLAARALGNFLANQNLPMLAGNPKLGKVAAAVVGIPLAYWATSKVDLVRENIGAIVLGMGMAPVEGYIRGLPILGGQQIAMLTTPMTTPSATPEAQSPNAQPAATSGLADYYTAGMLGDWGGGVDISHYGMPYRGMLGLGDADVSSAASSGDQNATDALVDSAEYADRSAAPGGSIPAVSTVTPTDVMAPMPMVPYAKKMTERMATPGERGYAGGIFGRTLFTESMDV